jgi:hypothetical protein
MQLIVEDGKVTVHDEDRLTILKLGQGLKY